VGLTPDERQSPVFVDRPGSVGTLAERFGPNKELEARAANFIKSQVAVVNAGA
jgi:hypothetical protein